jgi:hypothetical protein
VASAVFYVTCPEGAGSICFFDPRGSIPPFERAIQHKPCAGDLLIFPPWLSHAVSAQAEDAALRISISFNLVDDSLEFQSGRSGWGTATTALDVTVVEDGLSIDVAHDESSDRGLLGEDASGEMYLKEKAGGLVAELAAEGHSNADLHRLLGILVEESAALKQQLPHT